MTVAGKLSRVPESLSDPRRSAKIAPAEAAPQEFAYAAEALVAGYRLHGYRAASIDPLADHPVDVSRIAELDPHRYGLLLDDSIALPVELGDGARSLTLSELLDRLQASYCGSIALECGHVRADEQRRWLYAQMEAAGGESRLSPAEAKRVLERLVAAEVFEHYRRAAHSQYKQFSLEGGESLVPLLRAAIEKAAQQGVEDVVLGMPHRGRLTIMLHALDVPANRLLSLCSANPDPALAARDLKDHAGLSARMSAVVRPS